MAAVTMHRVQSVGVHKSVISHNPNNSRNTHVKTTSKPCVTIQFTRNICICYFGAVDLLPIAVIGTFYPFPFSQVWKCCLLLLLPLPLPLLLLLLSVLCNQPIFQIIPHQARSPRVSKRRTFGNWWCNIFTGQLPLLLPNQHCESTEGNLNKEELIHKNTHHTH